MKNLSVGLNVILIIAVIFLYIKVYSGNNSKAATVNTLPVTTKSTAIYYVDADTLFEKYTLFKSTKDHLEKKEDSVKSFLDSRSQALQGEAAEYQQHAQTMTDEQRQQIESGLMKKQQALVTLKDTLLARLQREQETMNDSINNHMQVYLKDFVKGKNIMYILGYHRTGEVLYANDSLNITKDILKGLNTQ